MSPSKVEKTPDQLARELQNFQEIASYIKPPPGEVPELDGFDIFGVSLPLNGVVGGDHMIFVDFKKRYDLQARIDRAVELGQSQVAANLAACRHRAGIALVDVAGHKVTDALLAAMFHQAFLLGALYELDIYGEITEWLFENLNTRFYKSSAVNKYLTMLYAEITEDAKFHFLSAAHPPPLVFSNLHDRFMEVKDEFQATSTPLGTMPSKHVIDRGTNPDSILGLKGRYEWNEWEVMGRGDILVLTTDGLLEHGSEESRFVPDRLEQTLRQHKHESAADIVAAIQADASKFAEPTDDITFAVIKRR